MTVPSPEIKGEEVLPQEKVETNVVKEQVETKVSEKPQEESKEDPNWKAFREARKQDRIQKEAAEKRAAEKEAEALALKAAMEAILNKPTTNSVANGYQEDETEDQRIEKKVQQAIAQREAQYEQQRQQREQQEYPLRLQEHFPDFQQTIASENLDYLDYHFPEVASPLKRLPDGYEKWRDIYKAIKKFIPNQNAKKDTARADANFNKPKSISSTGLTQGGEALPSYILSEERKAANWARMEKARKGLS